MKVNSLCWLSVLLAILLVSATDALAAIPAQFVAKQYTEALGRTPTQAEWQGWLRYFETNGCNLTTVKAAKAIYTGAEYAGLGLDNTARVLTLYRGLLNREPDPEGFAGWVDGLNQGLDWASAVDGFLGSVEFAGNVEWICSGAPYYFGGNPAIDVPVGGYGFQGGSGQQLQVVLNAAAPGTTVWLAQKSVTRVMETLFVPSGVTLATTGVPLPTRYALMGRIVRASNFEGGAVQLAPGAKLASVWVDGQRGAVGYNRNAINIEIIGDGGQAAVVTSSVSSNTAGWSTIFAGGLPVCRANISKNLVTVYNSDHYDGTWADGLSIPCQETIVTDNQIVDASDGAIVVFQGGPTTQKSKIRNNVVLNAGNSAYGGLIFDPLTFTPGDWTSQTPNFSGASFIHNTLWTGPNTHFDIALSVGTQAWYHDIGGVNGIGAKAVANTSGALSLRCNTGIAIDGMLDAIVEGNTFRTELVKVSACPSVRIGADILNGDASGALQKYVQAVFHSCIGH